MPIYEYRCGGCGHEFETIQKISDDPLEICPACEESALVKKVSAAGFRLKGGGWYETDFKSGGKRNVAASDSGSESTGSGSDAAGSESAGSGNGSAGSGSGKDTGSKSGASGSGSAKGSGESSSSKKSD